MNERLSGSCREIKFPQIHLAEAHQQMIANRLQGYRLLTQSLANIKTLAFKAQKSPFIHAAEEQPNRIIPWGALRAIPTQAGSIPFYRPLHTQSFMGTHLVV